MGGQIHEVPRPPVCTRARQAFIFSNQCLVWWAEPSKLSMWLQAQLLCISPTLWYENTAGENSPSIIVYEHQRSKMKTFESKKARRGYDTFS